MYSQKMQALLRTTEDPKNLENFLAESPVHRATFKAFDKVFSLGATLEDLPFLVFLGKNKEEIPAKKAA